MTLSRGITLPPFPRFCADVLDLDLSTRKAHMVIASAMDGLPLDDEGLALFRQHAGREAPRPEGYPYVLTLTGRQSGKTEQAAARLVYTAAAASLAGARDVGCVGISQTIVPLSACCSSMSLGSLRHRCCVR